MSYKKLFTSVTLLCVALVLMFISIFCLTNYTPNVSNARYKNAIYIYMCGSTLETKNGVATKNITDILESNVPAETTIVIQTGGTRKWRDYNIPNDSLVLYEVKNKKLIEVKREQDASMGDAQTLSSFLNFCNENYPADNTTLLFWNHGSGSVDGVCLDENHNFDGLSVSDINDALDETCSHFTNVCFDACLMANYETARVISNHADTMIASQELEPALGWDYKTLIENLGREDFSFKILDSYKKLCEAKGKRLWTLSSINLKQFAQVEVAFNSFCDSTLTKNANENNLQSVTKAADNSMNFGGQNGKSNFVDLGQLSEQLDYYPLMQAIKNCTNSTNGEDRQGATGLSIFFPLSGLTELQKYLMSETNEAYSLFLGSNYKSSSTNDTIKFIDDGSISDNKFNFKISQSSMLNVQSVVYDIYQLMDREHANCLGFDNDIQSNKKGEFSIDFNGKWVALNGNVLTCEPLDSVGDTSVFSSPVILNGDTGDLRFTYNLKTDEFSLQGFVPKEADETQGRLQDINTGDEITILSERFKDSNGLETEYIETEKLTVDDELELSSITLPNGNYQIYAIITDLYGNDYITNNFIIKLVDGKIAESTVDS